MTMSSQQIWLNNIYDAVYSRHEKYYEDSITLLCLLVMSANYWDPTTIDDIQQYVFLPLIIKN